MDLGLSGSSALVSGASSGLGLASAMQLAAEGCNVAICSRNEERIKDAASSIRETVGGSSIVPIVCDVTDEAHIRSAIDRAVAEFGKLNILVTNAGGPPSGFISDFDADDWRSALELNLISTINLVRHALDHLLAAARTDGHARVLMIGSVSAKEPIPNLYLSNAARAGVLGFAKSLAAELGPEGITVNTLLPGYTRTDRLSQLSDAIQARTGQTEDEVEAGWTGSTVLKRLGRPEEFAAAVTFLASRRASFITGVALPVDGGRVRHLL